MSKVRAHVLISGRVQGVYYRLETREQAVACGVTGWVRNRPDRSVEGVFEGEKENVDKLIDWCRKGPAMAIVRNVQVAWEPYRHEFSQFDILF
jgi:acylphosphatase